MPLRLDLVWPKTILISLFSKKDLRSDKFDKFSEKFRNQFLSKNLSGHCEKLKIIDFQCKIALQKHGIKSLLLSKNQYW